MGINLPAVLEHELLKSRITLFINENNAQTGFSFFSQDIDFAVLPFFLNMELILNKNAFQKDAYRPLQWPSLGEGVSAQEGVCPRGVSACHTSRHGQNDNHV